MISITRAEHDKILSDNHHHFQKLESIMREYSSEPEGNCMYKHLTYSKLDSDECINKRRNLMTLAKYTNRILEIGFNAGHSVLCMLLANPNLEILSIDLGEHEYSHPCYEYIRGIFPKLRIKFGSSIEIIPTLIGTEPVFDMYHIDGSHAYTYANLDFFLCHLHARIRAVEKDEFATVILDDTNIPHIGYLWDNYLANGHLKEYYLEDVNEKGRGKLHSIGHFSYMVGVKNP